MKKIINMMMMMMIIKLIGNILNFSNICLILKQEKFTNIIFIILKKCNITINKKIIFSVCIFIKRKEKKAAPKK
jgi:hypothetical protein